MGDDARNLRDPTSFPLPPGSRFYPSEEQLICYYLTSKNSGTNYSGIDVIKEVDLYNFDPFNLPDTACFRFGRGGRRQHWYCYVGRIFRESEGRRAAGAGYWRKRGRSRDVVGAGAGEVVVGTRKSFEFYLGDSPKTAVRTHWVMYEYALIGHHMASFVLCRVFFRWNRINNLSERVLSSCAEESVATVRDIGVQYDGTVTSVVSESKMHDKNTHDQDKEVLKFSKGHDRELDGQISRELVSEQELIVILEEDFIELDDLQCPLQGID